MVRSGDRSGQRIQIQSTVVIGRQGADVVIDDTEMSGRHASVEPVGDAIGIRDLGSTNGTFVNNVRIEAPTLLNPGHTIRMGRTVFEVISEQAAATGGAPQGPPQQQPQQQGPPAAQFQPVSQQQGGAPAPVAQPQAQPAVEVKAGPGGMQWVEARGRYCVVRAPARSFAAQAVNTEVQQADMLASALQETLQVGDPGAPVDIYLVDPPVGPPSQTEKQAPKLEGVGANGIVRVVTSESVPAPIAGPLTFLLVTRWFSPDAASLSVIVEGLAGIAAGRAGYAPPPEETHGLVQQDLEGGAEVSVLPKGGDWRGAPPPNRTVATSFVSFMIEMAEPGTFSQFLAAYNPDRRDEAAMQFYEQSLSDLEKEWSTSMKGMGDDFTLRSALKFLTPLIKPHFAKYLEVILYMVFGVILANLLPVVAGCITDGLATAGDPNAPDAEGLCGVVAPQLTSGRMLMILLVLVIAYAVEAGLQLRRAYVIGGVFARIGAGLQERMFAHLQRLSHRFFADARIGDLNSRLSQDLEELQGALESIYSSGAQNLMMLIIGSFTVITQSPIVGAIVLLIIPAFVIIQRILGPRLAMTSYEMQEISGDTSSVAQENLSAHAVVKALGLEERSVTTYRERLQQGVQSALRLNVITQMFEGSINMTSNIARLTVIGIGGLIIIGSDSGDAGSLVTILLILPNIIDAVAQLADVGQVGQAAAGSVARANEIFEEPIDILEKPNAAQLPPVQREIHYENVTFGYDEDVPILKGLDLKIPKGKHVAIVGPSGSGKSTIVNLLMRFWDPQDGAVKIDGVDIRDASLASLRGQIGLVFQETFVFNLSFRENIRISKPDATDQEIEAAVRAAQLESFVLSLPGGYETVLGERGSRMSGGQRQRLSIARALLRNPPILILDEATSALDARTEAEILEVLDEVVKNRTTITITHRLGIAADADQVVVLEDGHLVEQGAHNEIVGAGGLYQKLWEEQMGKTPVEKSSRLGLEAARLKKIPLFSDLDSSTLADLALQLNPERYLPGQDIVRQGDPGDKLYVISRGQADVFVQEGAVETKVNQLKDGDYFGEFALLTHQPRTATVRAVAVTDLFTLSRRNFMSLIENQPKLKSRVDKFVSERRSAFDAAAAAAGIG